MVTPKWTEAAIKKEKSCGKVIFGICGGYQMLGHTLNDLHGVEEGGTIGRNGFAANGYLF